MIYKPCILHYNIRISNIHTICILRNIIWTIGPVKIYCHRCLFFSYNRVQVRIFNIYYNILVCISVLRLYYAAYYYLEFSTIILCIMHSEVHISLLVHALLLNRPCIIRLHLTFLTTIWRIHTINDLKTTSDKNHRIQRAHYSVIFIHA